MVVLTGKTLYEESRRCVCSPWGLESALLWRVLSVWMVNLKQLGVTWKEKLNEELSRSGWFMGMSVKDFHDFELISGDPGHNG